MAREVLLIIDMQKDFLKFHNLHPKERQKQLIHKLQSLLKYARDRKVPIIHLIDSHKDKHDTQIQRIGISHCLAGSEGEEVIDELKPNRKDYIVRKPRYGGWYKTDLEKVLKKLKAKTLVFTGILADCCIQLCAYEAWIRDFEVTIIEDCIDSRSDRRKANAISWMKRFLKGAKFIKSEEWMA